MDNSLIAKIKMAVYSPILCVFMVASCSLSRDAGKKYEIDSIINPGEKIVFTNPNGSGEIIYHSPFKRILLLSGEKYLMTLIQREQEWRGQAGLYNPGAKPIEANADVRIVADESIVRFGDMGELNKFLREGGDYFKWVPGRNGLVLGYLVTPHRGQINLSLYRMYLNGEPLATLPKEFSYNGKVEITGNKIVDRVNRD